MQELIELLRQLRLACEQLQQEVCSDEFSREMVRQSATITTDAADRLGAISALVYQFNFQSFLTQSEQFISQLEDLERKDCMALDVLRKLSEYYSNIFRETKSRELSDQVDLKAELQELVSAFQERRNFLKDWKSLLEKELTCDLVRQASPSDFNENREKIKSDLLKIEELKKNISERKLKIDGLIDLENRFDDRWLVERNLHVRFACSDVLATIKRHLQAMDSDEVQTSEQEDNQYMANAFNRYNEAATLIKLLIEKINGFKHQDFIRQSTEQALKAVDIISSLRELKKAFAAQCRPVGERELEYLDQVKTQLGSLKTAYQKLLPENSKIKKMAIRLNEVYRYQQEILDPLVHLEPGRRDYLRGELFDYTYALYRYGRPARHLFDDLKRHGENHRCKADAIAGFLDGLSNCKTFHEVKEVMEKAMLNPELMDSTTHWGRKLGWESTAAVYIKKMKQVFDIFQQTGLQVEQIRSEVNLTINKMKQSPLEPVQQTSYSCLKDIFAQLKPYGGIKEVGVLLAELVDIAGSRNVDDHAKIVRMVVATHQAQNRTSVVHSLSKTVISSEGDATNIHDLFNTSLSLFPISIEKVWKSGYPFSARYQQLKFNVSQCGTKRSCGELWSRLDELACNAELSEIEKYNKMVPVIVSYHAELRLSAYGSPSLFGQGSRLADALQAFMKDRHGLNLNTTQCESLSSRPPSLFLSCLGMAR